MSEAHAIKESLKGRLKKPMSTSPVRISSYGAKEAAVATISDFEEDGKWWVHFRKSGEDRSQKQRRLMALCPSSADRGRYIWDVADVRAKDYLT